MNSVILKTIGSRGTIALIVILIISTLILVIALTIGFLNQGILRSAGQDNQSSKSYYLAQACAETALIKLKQDINYVGDETLNIEDANCQIGTILGSGNENRTIQAWANFQEQVRKLKIKVSVVNPQTQIISWQEVADF